MTLSRAVLRLLPALATITPAVASATPPPPAPTATYSGNQTICLPRFAIRLGARERAGRYSDDFLVMTGPRLALGIRIQPAAYATDAFRAFRANRLLQPVIVPGVGHGQRHPVTEWPGNRRRGWAYWFPQGSGPAPDYVSITADQFAGTAADYALLRRVLTGDARRRICPQS